MPVINTDQTSTVFVNTNDANWLFTTNTSIKVTNQYGIYESGSGNTLEVRADIKVVGMTYAAIQFQGATSSVHVGATSLINATAATTGIQYDGAGGDITVDGIINGGTYAIHGAIWADVINNGKLTGQNGIVFGDAGSDITNNKLIDVDDVAIATMGSGSLVVNAKGAQIHSNDKGIVFSDSGDGVIVNKGLLQANNVAIESGADNLSVTNTGKIIGDILLGAGEDRFDTRTGDFIGKVYGGDNDDKYLISHSSVKIGELLNGGVDTVYSTASYTLSNHIENLVLRGGANLDGHGSLQENSLTGNVGNNHLFGKSGDDTLAGGKGTDFLTGGNDSDAFVFNNGYGKDTITDFENGIDRISSMLVMSQQDFDDLKNGGHIKQVQDDVVIDFGGGDKLVLQHFLKGNLDYGDF